MQITPEEVALVEGWQADWNKFIRDCLGARLDREQRRIVDSVNHNRKTSVRSGNARGKDYTAACISLTFAFLYHPSKVINTAPTDRQAIEIEMAEISRLHRNSKLPLGGKVMSNAIRFSSGGEPIKEHYLLAFKSDDKNTEAWSGFHSPNILVVVTEASGIASETFNAVDGILTGTISRLLIVFNPNRLAGEAYKSTRSPAYSKLRLNCLNAPNVRAKKILIPGQVDYEWVADKVTAWCSEITAEQAVPVKYQDFRFEGKWYRPSDLFRIKVLGEFPQEDEAQLIPMPWIEAANKRWHERCNNYDRNPGNLSLGCDIAGMGSDRTVFAPRRKTFVETLRVYNKADHMQTAGLIKTLLAPHTNDVAPIDTIGEGAGVYSRDKEMGVNVVSAKFSEGTNGRRDLTGQREFVNMRAWCYWAVRDALDPDLSGDLALPVDDELAQELTATKWETQSSGKIKIVDKDTIKELIGRSPDKADALALSYWPARSGWGFVSSGDRK
jgi:hypothetical protein